MTPKERAAMQQALVYFEAIANGETVKPYEVEDTITALREALEQPDGCDYCNSDLFAGTKCNNCGKNKTTDDSTIKHTTAENYEHFLSYMYGRGVRHNAFICQAYFDGADAPYEEYEAYMAAHPEQLVSQEPVGEMALFGGLLAPTVFKPLPEGTKLYTAPQPVKEVELTDDELEPFIDEWWEIPNETRQEMKRIFRAVIAADREKNK